MNYPNSRRDFLLGRFRKTASDKPVLRPPVAVDEESFIRLCSRCGDCSTRCPGRIIVIGRQGYPSVDFGKGECTFCDACSEACQTGALHKLDETHVWVHRAQIGETCLTNRRVECRSCADFCPVSAIRFQPMTRRTAQVILDREKCTGCGACVAPCPVNAITIR